MDEQRAKFEAWAKDKGYDTAHTYDTERNKWVFFNPMTADLWITWQAATQRQQERIAELEGQLEALRKENGKLQELVSAVHHACQATMTSIGMDRLFKTAGIATDKGAA